MRLTVKNMSFGYTWDRRVLRDITVSFRSGQMTGLLGPNGSGKTTLMRLLTGAVRPDAGQIRLNGQAVAALPPRALARDMAFVPQRPEISFDFTALDVVLMGRLPHLRRLQSEGPEDLRIARRSMRRLGVLHLAKRSISELSGGELQRVTIARALCQEARILLLDEPVSSLDIRHQIDTLRLIRTLVRENGVTCICVLHDINLAAHFCDRLCVLSEGRIAALGHPAAVVTPQLLSAVYGIRANVVLDADDRPRIEPRYD